LTMRILLRFQKKRGRRMFGRAYCHSLWRSVPRISHSVSVRQFCLRAQSTIDTATDTGELERNLEELERLGYTIVHDVFTEAEIKKMQADFVNIEKSAMELISNTPAQPRVWFESGVETRSQYWRSPDGKSLALQAGEGRYDLWRGFQKGFFASPAVVHNPKIERIVERCLVKEYTNYGGVILSYPASSCQYYHRDTDTLSNTDTNGESLMQVDDFYFTTLIPITVDMTIENGATDFMVGSHRQSADKFNQLSTAQANCPVGAALIFNGKINHRGMGNNSKVVRPTIYTVYHKRWYNDNFRMGVEESSGSEPRAN